MKTFTPKDAEKITALPIRRIRFYVSQGVIVPEEKMSPGRGVANEFSVKNLIELGIVKVLSDAGLDLSNIKKIMKETRKNIYTYLDSICELIIKNPADKDLKFLKHFLLIFRSGRKIKFLDYVSYEEQWIETRIDKEDFDSVILVNVVNIIRRTVQKLAA